MVCYGWLIDIKPILPNETTAPYIIPLCPTNSADKKKQ